MRRMRLVGAWVVVLMLTMTVTWQIVSAADTQVSDRPGAFNVAAPNLSTTTAFDPSPTVEGSTSSTSPETTLPTGSTSATTAPGSTNTSSGSGSTSSTSTPTAPPAAWQTKVIKTSGGTVVVSYRPGEVMLETATPKAGFSTEVEDAGPPSVKVKFESENDKIEVKAEWSNGDLDVEVSEDDD